MTTPFSLLQSRTNAAVLERLADAEAVLEGGVVIPVIFEATPGEAFGILSGATKSAVTLDELAPPDGAAITIGGTSYTVSGAEPDMAGFTRLGLVEV